MGRHLDEAAGLPSYERMLTTRLHVGPDWLLINTLNVRHDVSASDPAD